MCAEHVSEENKNRVKKPVLPESKLDAKENSRQDVPVRESKTAAQTITALQSQVGNRAVQRMLVQRSGDGAFELDDDTASRINQQRGGGQSLDAGVQRQMGSAMGHDFSGVRVHTSSDAHHLNEQVGAVAFTTGSDIFFRQGAYSPGSSSGQELLAHELTHVVQQSSGAVPGGGKMTVNAPDDSFEQEADAVAKAALSQPVQRQELEEEELQTKRIQRDELPEEEELQMKRLQRQELEEEEELQMKRK
ncbi:MAG: DUF4157 domain-containing protein [Anaerolineales bacterium]|jgi:hypothetical protein|nr:DUF4157 domain-containing protein [Anaerolineales bacterium]